MYDNITIEVIDTSGKRVSQYIVEYSFPNELLSVDESLNLSSGMHLLLVSNKYDRVVKKFIVKE